MYRVVLSMILNCFNFQLSAVQICCILEQETLSTLTQSIQINNEYKMATPPRGLLHGDDFSLENGS